MHFSFVYSMDINDYIEGTLKSEFLRFFFKENCLASTPALKSLADPGFQQLLKTSLLRNIENYSAFHTYLGIKENLNEWIDEAQTLGLNQLIKPGDWAVMMDLSSTIKNAESQNVKLFKSTPPKICSIQILKDR